MWYLQRETFLLICLYCFIIAVIRKLTFKNKHRLPINIITFIASIVAIFLIDINLGIFYIAYVFVGLLLCYVLFNIKNGKKILFTLFSIGAILPIFFIRAKSLGIELPDSLTYLNYMFFIPVFTSGPIFRYRDFVKTYNNPIILTVDELADNIKRIIRGMFKKVVLFQILMIIQAYILQLEMKIYVSLMLTALSWFLLYFDLSGYSDVAIGFGKIAGYNVPENFKNPWKSPSFTMFWRSWHCTLSDWIREHIYILVSKLNLNRTYSAILAIVTMIIMALWHGFNMPYFIAGGLYLGLLLAIENLLGISTVNKRKTKKSIFILRCFVVNFLFALNTLVFTISSDQLIAVLKGFFKF